MEGISRRRRRNRGSQANFDSSVIAFDHSSGSDSNLRGSDSLEDLDSNEEKEDEEEEEDLTPSYP